MKMLINIISVLALCVAGYIVVQKLGILKYTKHQALSDNCNEIKKRIFIPCHFANKVIIERSRINIVDIESSSKYRRCIKEQRSINLTPECESFDNRTSKVCRDLFQSFSSHCTKKTGFKPRKMSPEEIELRKNRRACIAQKKEEHREELEKCKTDH